MTIEEILEKFPKTVSIFMEFKIPCLVFREVCEWREAVNAGTAILSTDSSEILDYLKDIKNKGKFYKQVKKASCPYGGNVAKKIVDILEKELRE